MIIEAVTSSGETVFVNVLNLNDLIQARPNSAIFVENRNNEQWSEQKENLTFKGIVDLIEMY